MIDNSEYSTEFSRFKLNSLALLFGVFAACCVVADEQAYSPPVSTDYPTRVFWGDTHLHTALSGDAFLYETRLGPDAAYRFARGEEIVSTTGQPAKLERPLDFLVVAEHANNMGASYARGNLLLDPEFRKTRLAKLWKKARAEVLEEGLVTEEELKSDSLYTVHREGLVSVRHEGFIREVWEMVTETADRHNDPGSFTAFNGYEWTPGRGAVHRVVIFRDDGSRVNQILPFSSFDSSYVEDLWEFMGSYERDTGGSVLAIPHNSNLTSGLMFETKYSTGEPYDGAYVETRARWEPLLEVTQIKGDSETHPLLSPEDPFADFETWNGWSGMAKNPNRSEAMIPFEYARSALKLGLEQQVKNGANPFKFGMIGSTDSHTALASAEENNIWGKFARDEPNPDRFENWPGWQASASGYAAVWATENTREALFDAMQRKETYATTGPRMTVRFFGGWDFNEEDAYSPELAKLGYRHGVPMGGDLAHGPDGASPRFLIRGVRDSAGANLDRVQVVKGWHDLEGALHERVYDVALSDGRRVNADGSVEAVGSTVDVEEASYSNSIGDPELATVWRDPDFDAEELSFYYVRVLEIPTPRWTAYDAKHFGLTDLSDEIPMIIQERAYTSPIWYTPR